MSAGRYDFEIPQGTTFSRAFTYRDSEGNPFDLSGASIELKAYRTITSDAIVLDASTAGGEITVGSDGQFELSLTAAQTSALNFETTAYYQLEVTFQDGTVKRPLEGNIALSREKIK